MSGINSRLPRVVALMPAWNSAAFIERTLEALSAQTYRSLEVLISDDASTDNTATICAEFVAKHPQFRLLRPAERQGWIGNVNALLRQAKGDYFFFAFHDDPPMPNYVASLVEALDSNPRAVLAFSDIQLATEDGIPRTTRSYAELDSIDERVERARRVIQRRGLWWIPNRGLFRAQAASQIGGMRRHLAGEYSADFLWLLRLALLGEFVRVPQPLIIKMWREAGLSRSWKGTPWQSLGVATACAYEIARSGIPIGEQATLLYELTVRAVNGLRSKWQAHKARTGAELEKD